MAADQMKGVAAALVSSLLAAIVFAYVFCVPIPFWTCIGPLGGEQL